MKKLKIYLDTSAIGYLDEEKSPQQMAEMHRLWEQIKDGKYDVVVSRLTLEELSANQNMDKVKKLAGFLAQIEYAELPVTPEAENVADLVFKTGLLIAKKHRNDRLHIGCAITNSCDIIVSMNFKHLVNVKTIRGVRAISSLEGYNNIDIVQPAALIFEEGDDEDEC